MEQGTTNQTVINSVVGSVFGHVYHQHEQPAQPQQAPTTEVEHRSKIHLSKQLGNKIDLIRVLYAMYDLGMFCDEHGGKLTKKDFFEEAGRAFNVNLSTYKQELSSTMQNSNSLDNQLNIIYKMRDCLEELFNSK